jgi:thymidylate kinase
MTDLRGRFIALTGPDGSGKTTVARSLIDDYPGPTAYVHFRPPVLRPLPSRPPDVSIAPPDKGSPAHGLFDRMMGWLRLARSTVVFWLAYLIRIRPALERGTLVVADRWSYGYVAQPLALRYFGPARLAAAMVSMTPRPDLVAVLAAPADVIHERKGELTLEQIEEELERWGRMSTHSPVLIDAALPPEDVVRCVRESIGGLGPPETLEEVARDLG